MDKENINVLQVLDKCAMRGSPIHGVSRLLMTWWPGFENTNINLSLCVFRGSGGTCSPFEKIGVVVEDLNRHKIDPRTIFDLIKIIRRDKIHILHCHGYGAPTFGRVAALICRIPVIIHEHMIDESIPTYQKIVDWMLSPFTAKGLAISYAVKNFMTKERSVPIKKMEILNNCVPETYFREYNNSEKENIANKHNIELTAPLVGIVGRLDPIKGHADFIHAAQLTLNSFDKVKFIIVGDGEIKSELIELVSKLNITNNVKFLGHCDNVIEIVALLDILVISSHQEGFSLAAIEGMAQKKPIIATRVGGLPDVIEHEVSGVLVSPKNPIDLAEAISRLLSDVELSNKLAVSGFEKCTKNFSSSVITKRLVKIYNEIH